MKLWQRPKTTRMYFHPPMAERMFTVWREGKIIFGENEIAVRNEYNNLTSAGMWFLNSDGEQFDFHDTVIYKREDGIPVHKIGNKLGEADIFIETYADFEKVPKAYIKVRVENNSVASISEKLSVVLRTGKEVQLVYGAPDVYKTYAPDVNVWLDKEATWKADNGAFTDGRRWLVQKGDIEFSLCEECGIASANIELVAGAAVETVFTFDIDSRPEAVDYCLHKAEVIGRWEKELRKINKLPESVTSNAPVYTMIKNLAVQLLQCFTRPRGVDFVLARQGGLQRQVWTYETMPVIDALSRIGDFDDYIDPVIDVYFNQFLTESGEIVPLAIPWAMATGTVLYSFGSYAMAKGDKAFFEKYRDAAYRSFLWIKNTRAATKAEPGVIEGLFPPLRSCDDELVFQSWCSTDTFNIRGLTALAEAFEFFGDEAAAEVRAETTAYREHIMEIWRSLRDAQTGEELRIPYAPGVSDEVIMERYHFSYPISYFAEGMDIPVDEAERVLKTYTKLGMLKPDGTLFDRMPDRKIDDGAEEGSTKYNFDENGKCIVWYVCCHEYHWFKYFLRHGLRERCIPILRGVEKFAMTDEYYMCERYNQRDPYFLPWSPNASASGRTINMLLDFYT